MVTNVSLTNYTPNYGQENNTEWRYVEQKIFLLFLTFISTFGFLGNGFVIWLLGFCMKRNWFTLYILNLAVADIGVLVSMAIFLAVGHFFSLFICEELVIFMYSTGQFLLTVISIDRCVCVLFPLWHQVHRPAHMSIVVCALIWVFSFLLTAVHYVVLKSIGHNDVHIMYYQFFVNALLCVPFMVISALTLFFKIFLKPQQRKRAKLLTAIFITLLFFLIFAFPLNAIYLLSALTGNPLHTSMRYGLLCASINSSINPLIYFLVGRKKKKHPRGSMEVILQRLFEEE